jgi:hypothetical protein
MMGELPRALIISRGQCILTKATHSEESSTLEDAHDISL